MVTSQEQMVLMLDAHDRSALAAATAAAYRHMGEPLRQAVHDAEVVLDAAGAVDEDSATTRIVPDATAPSVDTIPSPLPPEPSHALAVHPLAPPPLDVVRQVLGGLDTRTGPPYAAPAAPVDIQSSFSDSPSSPEQHDDKPASCSMDGSNQSCYGSEFPHTLTDEDTSQTSNLPPEKEELLSLAAGMLGLTTTPSPVGTSLSAVPEPPAMVVGGTGLGAHSGGRRDSSGSGGSRLIPALHKPHGISSSSSGTSRNPPVTNRTDTPSRVRVHRSASMDADIVDDIMSPTSPNNVMSGASGARGITPGTGPPGVCGLSILKRPPTPIPLRGVAKSTTSSYRSGASSPIHSTRASVISLEDLAALTAVKEEDHVLGASMTIPDDAEEEEENGDRHSQLRVDTSQEEQDDDEEEGLPEWYSTPNEVKPGLPSARFQAPAQAATGTVGGVAMGVDEVLDGDITSPGTPGACAVLTVPTQNMAAGSKGCFMWSTPDIIGGEATTAAATPVSDGVEATAAAAAEVTPPVSIASDDNRPHTGIPQLDDAPGLVEEVEEIKDQIALRGYVGRAAAMAGALVHTGRTMAQAANLAEGALDTSDVIDFVCARTNLRTPDTVPDILAANRHHAPTPANTPASITPPLRTATATPKAAGASSPTTGFSVTTPPATPKTASEMLQQVDRHVSFTMYTGEQPPITASLASESKLPSDLPDHVQRPPPSASRVIPIAEAGYVKQKAVEEEYVDVVHCLPARLDSAMGGVCPASSAAVAAAHLLCSSIAPATAPPTPSAAPTAEVSVGGVLSEEVALP